MISETARPHQELANATSTLHADVHSTKDLKTKADQCVQDTIVAIRILDGHRNAQNGAYLKNHATFPLEFFDRITVQMRERMHWYKATIEVRDSWFSRDSHMKDLLQANRTETCFSFRTDTIHPPM
jgi:hypothetical protein